MDNLTLILGIIIMLVIAALDSIHAWNVQAESTDDAALLTFKRHTPGPKSSEPVMMDDKGMITSSSFTIHFNDTHSARAVRVATDGDPAQVVSALGLESPRPAIFISGGASYMSEEDVRRTRDIIEEGIAHFAAENGITIIDGGTESGVMQMVGDARRNHDYQFPLIGVAPIKKIDYPGYENPGKEASLEDSHSHFVLVDAEEWGEESNTIIKLAREISGHGQCTAMGVLINGGKIARQDILLATTQGKGKMPILVLEGSGRFADELATAFRTGKTNQAILKAIIDGGDIELVATVEGPEAMRTKLARLFKSK